MRYFCALLATCLMATSLFAGEGDGEKKHKGDGEEGRRPPVEFILKNAEAIGLTADQKAKLEELAKKMATPEVKALIKQAMEARRAGDEKASREIREKLKEILGPREEILTDEQKEKLKTLGDKGGHGKRPPKPEEK